MSGRIVDVWMQHPTLRHSNHEMFESLRRWTGLEGVLDAPLPLEATIASMDEGKVDLGLTAARYGPMWGTIRSLDRSCQKAHLRVVRSH